MLYDYLIYEDIKYINIYIERERDEKRERHIYIYINYELLCE